MGRSAPSGNAKKRFTVGFVQQKQENKKKDNLLDNNLKRQSVLPRRRLQIQSPFVSNSPVSATVNKKLKSKKKKTNKMINF